MTAAHRFVVGAIAILATVSLTRASIITLTFSGTVQNPVDYSGMGYVPSGITTGSTFVGTVTFDNSAAGTLDGSGDGYYRGTALNMTVNITVAGQYNYSLSTPSTNDEIDIIGSSFGLYKRGPTVNTSFSPNPPFSHIDFAAQTQTDILSQAIVTPGSMPSAGVSDQQTPSAGYYYVGANLASVQSAPEPASAALFLLAFPAIILRRPRVMHPGG